PHGLSARVNTTTWNPPPVFDWIAQMGGVSQAEMYRVFNMGVGLVLIVAREVADEVLAGLPEAWRLGEVVQGGAGLELVAGA
ncbi:MAG: AIR synthase-related protein, partial [Chloroflexota bacterium]|nr:AIR synthase-related protein [Chloroflexota bacterium]